MDHLFTSTVRKSSVGMECELQCRQLVCDSSVEEGKVGCFFFEYLFVSLWFQVESTCQLVRAASVVSTPQRDGAIFVQVWKGVEACGSVLAVRGVRGCRDS